MILYGIMITQTHYYFQTFKEYEAKYHPTLFAANDQFQRQTMDQETCNIFFPSRIVLFLTLLPGSVHICGRYLEYSV
jgi:hypothetical protein